MGDKTLDRYPSCANDTATSCEHKCTDVRDPCYDKESKNVTWVSWHAKKTSDVVELGHLTSPLDELTVVSQVNNVKENLEIVLKDKESRDIMKVDVGWNISSSGHITIKIDGGLQYMMGIPKQKLYGVTVG